MNTNITIEDFDCPFTTSQKVLSGKWSLPIIFYLKDGPMRFNQLLRQFNITHATLTKQLKQLANYGVINRKSYDQIPPKVEYSLTELGQKLIPTIQALADWGKDFIDYCDDHPHIVEFERPPLYK